MSGYSMGLKAGSGCSSFSVNWGLSQMKMALVNLVRPAMVLPRMESKVAESLKELVLSDMTRHTYFL